MSMALKYFDQHRFIYNPDPRMVEFMKPVLMSDVPREQFQENRNNGRA